ncbi:hypothetical protein A33K_14001 [Burkholderia humptydooensis MSMB43]|uniref:Uncharacterized protein n=1 Tax=Burkholderia humptydooensis MSMB43 TaxID=441157 RepID=A0ABN0GEB8_9BURK|nr:hypothetical protein A33K_14001 [Burkholderia humptydooensis MSMB43]
MIERRVDRLGNRIGHGGVSLKRRGGTSCARPARSRDRRRTPLRNEYEAAARRRAPPALEAIRAAREASSGRSAGRKGRIVASLAKRLGRRASIGDPRGRAAEAGPARRPPRHDARRRAAAI